MRQGAVRGRRGALRGVLPVPLLGLLTAAALLLAPALARADTSSTLTVVGTSDVSDSGLIANVIQPEFHAAYPQFPFKYNGSASGLAIQNAEAGNGQPSALIVHAPSLENQFVANGFSYNNQYGNAIFINDFVLVGPTADASHANVLGNAAHNVALAMADIATAGNNGTATFLTRGGTTTASGTTVEEHALWALLHNSGLQPSSLVLCAVSAADGGGMSPIKSTVQSTSGQPCPDSGTVDGTDAPSWYFVNANSTQSANVIATNACTVGTSGANSCYTLSDRGTYDYLSSGASPSAGTVGIPNLTIVTRNNGATAPGGANELINYFHVYITNPSKPGEAVNLTAAKDFVNFLTSIAFQSQLPSYLDDTRDPGGAPFKPDASPSITEIGLPSVTSAGTRVTVTGSVTNLEPGYPALSGKTVTIDEIVAGVPVPVAKSTTNASGDYSIRFTPNSSGAYQVSTGQISQIENATLTPPFGDILSPGATGLVYMTVKRLPAPHSVSFKRVTVKKGHVTVSGTLKPAPALKGATVELFALRATGTAGPTRVGKTTVGKGKTAFTIKATLRRGFRWILQLEYVQKGQTSTYSGLRSINVS
jgi:tungstate transport system substrate-binding protein